MRKCAEREEGVELFARFVSCGLAPEKKSCILTLAIVTTKEFLPSLHHNGTL